MSDQGLSEVDYYIFDLAEAVGAARRTFEKETVKKIENNAKEAAKCLVLKLDEHLEVENKGVQPDLKICDNASRNLDDKLQAAIEERQTIIERTKQEEEKNKELLKDAKLWFSMRSKLINPK